MTTLEWFLVVGLAVAWIAILAMWACLQGDMQPMRTRLKWAEEDAKEANRRSWSVRHDLDISLDHLGLTLVREPAQTKVEKVAKAR